MPGRFRGQAFRLKRVPGRGQGAKPVTYLLLLLDDELFSLLPRLLALVLPLARSLWARLFCVLALPPLLAACARLPLPRLEEDDDLEVRGAIDISCSDVVRPAHHARDHTVTLGAAPWLSVGCVCTSM
jgi:hypothetical protein